MRALLVLALLALAPSGVAAQTPEIERIDVLEAGLSELVMGKDPAGKPVLKSARVVEATTTIAAELGAAFGFRYVVVGKPAGATVALRMVTRYPRQGMRDANTGRTAYANEETVSANLGEAKVGGYRIDELWEIVPGVWVFELWNRDRKLAEQRFTLVRRP